MSKQQAAQQLKQLIAQYGPQLVEEPRRINALLRDLCAVNKREAHVLTSVAEKGLAKELARDGGRTTAAILLPRLAGQLHDELGTDESLALWAVSVWADAFGWENSEAALLELSRQITNTREQPHENRYNPDIEPELERDPFETWDEFATRIVARCWCAGEAVLDKNKYDIETSRFHTTLSFKPWVKNLAWKEKQGYLWLNRDEARALYRKGTKWPFYFELALSGQKVIINRIVLFTGEREIQINVNSLSATEGERVFEIIAPVIQDSVADATIAAWHVEQGEAVKSDQHLVDIETDKVILEIYAYVDGSIGKILKNSGEAVVSKEVLATLHSPFAKK